MLLLPCQAIMLTILKMISKRIGLTSIIATWLVFFGHVYLTNNVFFLDDLKIFYYPLEQVYAQFQHTWQLPLWSNGFGFGHPLLAWGQLGFFTPLHLLLRALYTPPLILLQISVVSYFLLGVTGMYVCLRSRRLLQLPSALGAITFTFCGFSIGHLNHVNFYTGTMLLPWLLVTLEMLIRQPTITRAAIVAIAAGTIALSAQPQIVIFVFIAAAIIGLTWILFDRPAQPIRLGLLLTVAAVLGAGLASFAILPLKEFLPETERADALPAQELLEFSYPPHHAITLLLPYFYGDHEHYWGAKGFQELAAFVGIIPLFLAAGAVTTWRTHRAERLAGLLLVSIAIAFGLGRYSWLYTYLVDQHYLTSLGVVGRFTFFFDVGIALLSAVGMYDLLTALRNQEPLRRLMLSGFAGLGIVLAPFTILALQPSREHQAFISLWQQHDLFLLSVLTTGIGLLLVPLLIRKPFIKRYLPHALLLIAAGTLVAYAWNYNPPTSAAIAFAQSPLTATLTNYQIRTGLPARLYSRPELIQTETTAGAVKKYTDPISSRFSIYQPLLVQNQLINCLLVSLEVPTNQTPGTVTVGLHLDPQKPAGTSTQVPPYEIGQGAKQRVCFTHVPALQNTTVWISFTSSEDSNVVAAVAPQNNETYQAYMTRVAHPTFQQWKASRKPLQVSIELEEASLIDEEAALLARHLQVTAGASGARWIGALGIREYRNFIEFFFANDQDLIDSDGRYAIERYRKILDFAGVTHLAQLIAPGHVDGMEQAGFRLVKTSPVGSKELRVYENPTAYPKAFLVPSGIWKPAADETRDAMRQPDFDPRQLVYLSGPTPPDQAVPLGRPAPHYTAKITDYEPTRVDVRVDTDNAGYVVLTDSATPQWQTFLDDSPAPQLMADSIFKAAYVPAGQHTVSFRYYSPAVAQARIITTISLLAIAWCILRSPIARLRRRATERPTFRSHPVG